MLTAIDPSVVAPAIIRKSDTINLSYGIGGRDLVSSGNIPAHTGNP